MALFSKAEGKIRQVLRGRYNIGIETLVEQ